MYKNMSNEWISTIAFLSVMFTMSVISLISLIIFKLNKNMQLWKIIFISLCLGIPISLVVIFGFLRILYEYQYIK